MYSAALKLLLAALSKLPKTWIEQPVLPDANDGKGSVFGWVVVATEHGLNPLFLVLLLNLTSKDQAVGGLLTEQDIVDLRATKTKGLFWYSPECI